jgi:hypothetical protein
VIRAVSASAAALAVLASGCGEQRGTFADPLPLGTEGTTQDYRIDGKWRVTMLAVHRRGELLLVSLRVRNATDRNEPAGVGGDLFTDRNVADEARMHRLPPKADMSGLDTEPLEKLDRSVPGCAYTPADDKPELAPDEETTVCLAYRIPSGERPAFLDAGYPGLGGTDCYLRID